MARSLTPSSVPLRAASDYLPADLMAYAADQRTVGSRVTCQPPPTSTDIDVLVLVPRGPVHRIMQLGGWVKDGTKFEAVNYVKKQDGYPNYFTSYRKGDVNIIVTRHERFYNLFSLATDLAQRLNLLKKPDRIALFQAVLYGSKYH
jgi:hypothetical protein